MMNTVEVYQPEDNARDHEPVANALMSRATIEQIVQSRNEALRLYEVAWSVLDEASRAVVAAGKEAAKSAPGFNGYHDQIEEVKRFNRAIAVPPRDEYLRTARKLVDCNAWAWVIDHTDLERLMDKEAKDKLRQQMAYVPEKVRERNQIITGEEVERGMPEFTVENVRATLERFQDDSGMIFRRGIANAFSKLDRRFRSHDGFKIGSRVILTRCFNENGSWCYSSSERDTLMDIERTFMVLDNKEVRANYGSAIGAIDKSRGGFRAQQSVAETEYFRIRCFQNGNAHLWMLRDDLVEQVNKLLAEHYGEVIGDGQTREADPLDEKKTTPAKFYGFYPTPEGAAKDVTERLPLLRKKTEPALRVLEPSAGTGNLARRLFSTSWKIERGAADWQKKNAAEHNAEHRFDNRVDVVELQPKLAAGLAREGIYNRVICGSFLDQTPEQLDLYDVICMNPPFDRERDVDHVAHALKFLKPDGVLHAIMSAGTEFRETKKSVAFRKLVIDELNGAFHDLPAGSFSEAGTNVNTIVLRVRKDARPISRW